MALLGLCAARPVHTHAQSTGARWALESLRNRAAYYCRVCQRALGNACLHVCLQDALSAAVEKERAAAEERGKAAAALQVRGLRGVCTHTHTHLHCVGGGACSGTASAVVLTALTGAASAHIPAAHQPTSVTSCNAVVYICRHGLCCNCRSYGHARAHTHTHTHTCTCTHTHTSPLCFAHTHMLTGPDGARRAAGAGGVPQGAAAVRAQGGGGGGGEGDKYQPKRNQNQNENYRGGHSLDGLRSEVVAMGNCSYQPKLN